MCGRYTLHSEPSALNALLRRLGHAGGPLPPMQPRFNIAPTQSAWVLIPDPQGLPQLRAMAFGFRPSFMSHSVINARAETVPHKPLFAQALAHHRCLVLASGFYEWAKAADGTKQPHHFTLVTHEPFVFAGLFRATQPRDPGHGLTEAEFVIVTTEANARVAHVHPRMPVIVGEDAARLWLAPRTPQELLQTLLSPYASDAMAGREVHKRVNRPSVDDKSCLDAPAA